MELLKSVFRSSTRSSKTSETKPVKKEIKVEGVEIKIKEDVFVRDEEKNGKSPVSEKNPENVEYFKSDRDVFNQGENKPEPTPRDRWNFPIRVLSKRLGNLTKEQQLDYLRRVEESISRQQQQLIKAQNQSFPQVLDTAEDQETMKEVMSHEKETMEAKLEFENDKIRSTKNVFESENMKIAAQSKIDSKDIINVLISENPAVVVRKIVNEIEIEQHQVTKDGHTTSKTVTTVKRTMQTPSELEKGGHETNSEVSRTEETKTFDSESESDISVKDAIKKFQAMSTPEKKAESKKVVEKIETDNKVSAESKETTKTPKTSEKKSPKVVSPSAEKPKEGSTPLKSAVDKKKLSSSTSKQTPTKTNLVKTTEKKESVEKSVKNTENIDKAIKDTGKQAVTTVTQVKKVIRSSEKATAQKSPLRPKSSTGSTKSPSPETASTTTPKRPPSGSAKSERTSHTEIRKSTIKSESKKSESSPARTSPPGAGNKDTSTPTHNKVSSHVTEKSKSIKEGGATSSTIRRSSITTGSKSSTTVTTSKTKMERKSSISSATGTPKK